MLKRKYRVDKCPMLFCFLRQRLSVEMSSLSAASVEASPAIEGAEQKKPLKPCCACPETKKARDACIIEKGEESCTDLIEAHKECMRALGFKI
uniref:Cytochrome c oxidase copper chaperone n=4 Tax=Cyprinoidei TaxID=30727 RepID=A0A9J7XRC2_CYPCA